MNAGSKLGWNIQYFNMPQAQKNGLFSVSRDMGCNTFVVIDDPHRPGTLMYELQNEFPDAYVILRMIPAGEDQNLHLTMTPWDFVNWYKTNIDDPRIIAYYNNEPNPPWAADCIKACIQVIQEARKAGLRVCVLNSSVGSLIPPEFDPEAPEDALAPYHYLFKAVAESDGMAFLGIHEYSRGQPFNPAAPFIEYPWLIGNFEFIVKYCNKNGIPVPPMLITEYGFDGPRGEHSIHRLIPFFASQDPQKNGHRRAAQLYLEIYEKLYRHAPAIKGIAGFTAGANWARWFPYDMFSLHDWHNWKPTDPPTFISYLRQQTPKDEQKMPVSGTKVVITKLPLSELNFRSSPAVNATNVIGPLRVEDEIHVKTGIPLNSGGYNWYEAFDPQGRPGWFAKVKDMETVPALPLTEPPDDDVPTDNTTLLQEVLRIIRLIYQFLTGKQP